MMDWKAWAKNPLVIAAICAAGALSVLAFYTIVYRIPDVEKRMDRLDADLRDQLKSMNLSLVGLRANVLRLCAQKKGSGVASCNVEELVSQAKSVSEFQAQFFNGAAVSLVAGWHEPQVTSEDVRQRLPRWPAAFAGTAAKPEMADLIMWSSAADSARWYEKPGNLVEVRFTNGSASFRVNPMLSRSYVSQLVSSLNTTADALHAFVVGDSRTEE